MLQILVLFFIIISACTYVPVDPAKSPAELNHNRLIMKDGTGEVEVGIISVANKGDIFVRYYNDSTIELRGLGDCGNYQGYSVKGRGFFKLSFSPETTAFSACIYAVQVTTTGFNAPSIGKIIYTKFNSDDMQPAKIEMNNVIRSGSNWVSLKSDATGLVESRQVRLIPSGTTGKLLINGCKMAYPSIQDYDAPIILSIESMYRNWSSNINEDCAFLITLNNDDFVKENGLLYVNVYKETGGYLAAPTLYEYTPPETPENPDNGGNKGKKMCIEFTDYAVAGMVINGKSILGKKLCVSVSSKYEIEAFTMKHRVFYGISNGSIWLKVK